jgi:hypothetical protein
MVPQAVCDTKQSTMNVVNQLYNILHHACNQLQLQSSNTTAAKPVA